MTDGGWGSAPAPVSTWKPQPFATLLAAPPKKAPKPRKKSKAKKERVEE